MDFITFLSGLFGGAFVTVSALYAYAKSQGVVLLPEDIGANFEALQGDYGELTQNVKGAIGNISLMEVGKIMARATELGKEGYTKEELAELGEMAVDAAKN